MSRSRSLSRQVRIGAGLVFCLAVAALFFTRCVGATGPNTPANPWELCFAGRDEPTERTPFVIGCPAAGTTVAIGDTLAVAFKRYAGFDYGCWGFQLVVEGGRRVLLAYTLRNDFGMEDENGVGLPATRHESHGDIHVLKVVLPPTLPASSGDSVSLATDSAFLELGLHVWDCCCPGDFEYVSSGPFAITRQ